MSDVIRIVDEDRRQPPVPALPGARLDMRVRAGRLDDFPFIDELQKANKHGVGFMWEKAIKGHIEKGNVLIAEAMTVNREQSTVNSGEGALSVDCSLGTVHCPAAPQPVGYVLGADRYLKRDELGVIYQMCVVPAYRRSLVAAHLLKAKFERSAYGCRLYCCWCAQDLAANKFWEAMGFVPLAFRTGGGRRKKDGPRMHIFWQKRIREGDTGDLASGGTPYWFPSITGAGAIGEDRIVLPIPPGTHWSDAKPVVLPEGPRKNGEGEDEVKLLEDEVSRLEREKKEAAPGSKKGVKGVRVVKPRPAIEVGGMRFGPPPEDAEAAAEDRVAARTAAERLEAELKAAKKAVRRAKKKFDPAQESFARELKDRWLEQVQARPGLIEGAARPRYAVGRLVAGTIVPPDEPGNGALEVIDEPERIEMKRLDAA